MDAATVAEWEKVLRDGVILGLASFIIVFEIAFKSSPNPYALGTALTLLGVPASLRLDSARRKRSNGDGQSSTSTTAEGSQ